MNHTIATNTTPGTPLVAMQESLPESASNAQLAFSGEIGLIVLGAALLGMSGYLFLLKLCKTLARSGNK